MGELQIERDNVCSRCSHLYRCRELVKTGARLPCQPEHEPNITTRPSDKARSEFDRLSLVKAAWAER